MKKRIISLIFLAILLSLPFVCHAQPSTVLSASAAITTKPGMLTGIQVTTDGSNSCTFTLYDNATAASGTQLVPGLVFTSSAANRMQAVSWNELDNVRFQNGVYASLTTSGTCSYQVFFVPD